MKKIYLLLLFLFSFSVFSQSSYDRIWAVNSGLISNNFNYSSYLVNDTDLYYPSDNKIVYYDLQNTTPIEFATLGTATTTKIDELHRDAQGNFYASGKTSEIQNFTTANVYKPTFDPIQNVESGTNDFLAKFDANGGLVFCTYTDILEQGGMAKKVTTTDALGNIYFIAYLPITETLPNAPFQTSVTSAEAFVDDSKAPIITKLNSNGQLLWKTFFCHHRTFIQNINVVNNQLVIAGQMNKNTGFEMTNPTFFSTPGALLENVGNLNGSKTFVNVFNEDGTRAWGTYLSTTFIHGLRTFGNAIYVLHQGSGLTATEGAYFGTPKTNVLTKLSNTGTRLWSNYTDEQNFNLDLSGNVFLFGATQQTTGIATADAYQVTKNPTNINGLGINFDGYHQILSQNGTNLLYGTYYGLQGQDGTSMIIPRNTGYISLGYINNYLSPTDFITQGNPLTTSENYSNYGGLIISLFDKTPLATDTFQLENVKVYPNPTINYLVIENLDGFSTNDTIEIYNMLGQKIQQQNNLSETTIEINTKNWSSGVYIVNVQSNGKVGSYKVVKK
ncbi:T9SS type A sorting domain-containing protein [Flavobacterium sp. I3-2]|uniref:T9SS type A sorting domain-containing protein n=1 Tax=Flavobacterium sp. I3-2 TaxID=2748319 RepID=UPI0015AE73F0|nr:T9SS type A sorting domain-containing protein [Flavobacterium sp. I3-2]